LTSVLTERGSDFAGLCRQIRAARLLERTPWHYALRTVVTLGVFAAAWWATVVIGASWFVLIPAAILGLVSTQLGFLGHDGGHQQIAASKLGNSVIGLIAGNLLIGLSIGWWVDKHNRHHANPNKEDHDPDIGEGVLVFTTKAVANRSGALARAITRNQAFLFFPLLTLEGLNLHVASVRWLATARRGRYWRTEIVLLWVHAITYLGAIFWLLPFPYAVAYIAVHQAVWGVYMGCSFAPNHKGMPIIPAHEKLDYLRRQVLTSRNVRGSWIVDQVLGGLNYQIEHHLFPSMPRGRLRRAQQLVRDYCAEHDVPYAETGLFASYAIALRHLHELGRPLRP
jgi:fatty acid desaturase